MSKAVARYTSIDQIRSAFYPRMARLLDLDPHDPVVWPWPLPAEVEKAVREQLEER
jgi:hypothetical protein